MKRITKQNKIVVIIVSIMLVLTIGYALFSETLNIKGTAKASGNFDLIFSEVLRNELVQKGASVNDINITNESKTLSIGDTVFNFPSSYIEVAAMVENKGSIDAVLEGIKVTGLSNEFKLTLTGVKEKELFKSGKKKKVIIKIEWLETSTITVPKTSFDIELVYNQVTEEYMPPKTEYKVGDEICIDSECFYTISDNGNTVTALSKYNLLVGNIYDSSADIMTPISKDIKGYGLQNERAKGQLENGLEWVGVLGYSETNYWYDKVTYKLKEEYGADYPAFVFDSNSNLYEHVKNYENHLKLLGKTSVITSLMTYEQLMYFSEIYESTGEIPTWFDDTSYWLGFSHNRTDFGVAGKYAKDNMYNIKSSFGVRPTITIDKSEI